MKKKTKKLYLSKDTIASLSLRTVAAATDAGDGDSTKPICMGSQANGVCTVVDTTDTTV